MDFSQIKASIMADVLARQINLDLMEAKNNLKTDFPDLIKEIAVLFPEIKSYTLSNIIVNQIDTTRRDTLTLFGADSKRPINTRSRSVITRWIKGRIKADTVKATFN